MIDQKKRTVRFETSSLLPLKLVLIEAEKDLHARAPKEHDVNEELALKLIAKMRMSLRGAFVATTLAPHYVRCSKGEQSPSLHRRLLCRQRSAARNDIQLEP
ncbi:MAG TPA: hypothetical protein VNA23_01445 [Anaerolineales bacterium]|nr:hypothetical protein [Anaerolineales bacterium]